jgi:hypothetical protein
VARDYQNTTTTRASGHDERCNITTGKLADNQTLQLFLASTLARILAAIDTYPSRAAKTLSNYTGVNICAVKLTSPTHRVVGFYCAYHVC